MIALNLSTLFNALVEIPDVHDIIIKDKILCVKTDSSDYVKVDFSQLGETGETVGSDNEMVHFMADNMTLTDFGVKYKTIKVLSDNFKEIVNYHEDDESVSFIFEKLSYVSRIPIINNNYAIDEWNELATGEYLGSLMINQKDFLKIKTIIELYKAFPSLKLEDGKLYITVTTSSKQDTSDFLINETNIFENKLDIEDPIKLQKTLFVYNFESDVELKFYKDEDDNLKVISKGKIKGFDVEYAFKTAISAYSSLDGVVDISDIDLQQF